MKGDRYNFETKEDRTVTGEDNQHALSGPKAVATDEAETGESDKPTSQAVVRPDEVGRDDSDAAPLTDARDDDEEVIEDVEETKRAAAADAEQKEAQAQRRKAEIAAQTAAAEDGHGSLKQ